MTSHHTLFPSSTSGKSVSSIYFDRQSIQSLFLSAIRFSEVIPESKSSDFPSLEYLPMQIHMRFLTGIFGNRCNVCDVPGAFASSYYILQTIDPNTGETVNIVNRGEQASDYTSIVHLDLTGIKNNNNGYHGYIHSDMERNDKIVDSSSVGQSCMIEIRMTNFRGETIKRLPVVEMVFLSYV